MNIPRTTEEVFAVARGIAADRVEKAELYVVSETLDEATATLEMASSTYPELTETVYFVRENGRWKIGKD